MTLTSRRSFLSAAAGSAAAMGFAGVANAADKGVESIAGFESAGQTEQQAGKWEAVSDRKIRVGLVGYGLCEFAAHFYFQDHPNVEVGAVSDLLPDRCSQLAKVTRCETQYPSLEELVKDDSLEAVFVATDAPSHADHCLEVLKHGKHVACAVPAVYGSLEDADRLYNAVRESGLHYMLFETSCYHPEAYAMRKVYEAGGFGKLVYSEGEYWHYMPKPLPSFKDWRVGLPPQYYPTHATAYYVGITGKPFTEVTCMGMKSEIPHLQAENNRYSNPFGTEIALLRTSEGGMARMAVGWQNPAIGAESGRVRGQRGCMYTAEYKGQADVSDLQLDKPPLPPGVEPGYHGGSHGYLCEEFVTALLEDRTPLIDIAWGLNMTVPGIVAHQSALKDGETMKVPQYSFERKT
jgi:predicted dehydrogenase